MKAPNPRLQAPGKRQISNTVGANWSCSSVLNYQFPRPATRGEGQGEGLLIKRTNDFNVPPLPDPLLPWGGREGELFAIGDSRKSLESTLELEVWSFPGAWSLGFGAFTTS